MRICIDAGHNHSGFDTGAIGNGLREQDIAFKIADKLKQLLVSAGIGVTMTRAKITDNVGVNAKDSINQRARIANTTKCDYFISIHCNSSTNKSANGTETLIYGFGGQAERIAKAVNDSVVSKLGTYNRGIKVRCDLGVLSDTSMPAILVETAFISNEKDAKLLKEKTDDFAQAIFDGLLEHLDKKEEVDIIERLSEIIEINDKTTAKAQLLKEKEKDSSLYWILYKIANKEGA